MGTPAAAAVSLQRLIDEGHEIMAAYTQPDKPKGRGQKLTASPVKELALEYGLKVVQPASIKTPEALEVFRSHQAEAAVVVAYGRILPVGFLTSFQFGAINLHFSLLPKYRGAAPVNWAIVNGEEFTGVTTMRMDEGLDTGDILLQSETRILGGENAVDLTARLAGMGSVLLCETLTRLETIEPRPQNDELATFAPILKKSDGLIDWDLTADVIVRRVRGLQPFPTAFTFFGGKRLTIWNAYQSDERSVAGSMPGTVTTAGGRLSIVCGAGTAMLVDEIQFEGKRRLPVDVFLNGSPLKDGDVVGS